MAAHRPYDEIVVGAGSSGAPLAARLSEDPERRVLLLEAGPDFPSVAEMPAETLGRQATEAGMSYAWPYTAQATPQRSIPYPAGKVTGGGSAINSGVALRGAPADYDEWAATVGSEAWSFDAMVPYFRRLETDHDFDGPLHGTDGPVPIRRTPPTALVHVHRALHEACRELGFPEAPDHNAPDSTGVGPWPMNVEDGVRISTALAYLGPARGRPNLTIRPDALVSRVCFEGRRAIGVEVGGELIPARRVTLSAGAIATPGILLRSGIGAAAAVRALGREPLAELPGVGEGLLDHAFTWLAAVPAPGVCDLSQRSVQTGLRYTAAGSGERNDMQLLIIVPVDLEAQPELAAAVGAQRIFMIGAGLQRPRSRGRVTWSDPDPGAAPQIDLALCSDPLDVARLVDGLRLAWRVAHSAPMRPHLERIALLDAAAVADDEALAAYVRGNVITFKHPAGTARMGADGDPLAVLDARCRVRGVERLHVADASIMPNIPRANNNLTCIAIGERMAELLRAEPV